MLLTGSHFWWIGDHFMNGNFMERFLSGNAFDAYDYFGVHEASKNGVNGYIFRVYAPRAARVCLMGDFSEWKPVDMRRDEHGVYSCFCGNAVEGQMYKYVITAADGTVTEKSDPYAFRMELPPATASVIYSPDRFRYTDSDWVKKRSDLYNEPLNIYEVHLGSWVTKKEVGDEATERFSYSELIPRLIPYLKVNGYTHVEIMPLAEHPFSGSWGYQCSGFFSATARYGNPDGLMRFVDICHRSGIGVIFDFVPVHFAADSSFMHLFDGSPLYEYDSIDMMYNEWGSCNFCHSKPIVSSFLLSAADFWVKKYHADGLRMDAISNMIYWQGNSARGVNKDAVDFLRRLNSGLHSRYGNVLLMAEDSTNYLKVTAPVEYDGLGFDYKWDMGWMNDTLDFFKLHPADRKYHYHKITFSMAYFYNELYLLALSHDEVVHGKATVLQKMWGDYEVKFPQCRTLYMYMYTHPGKKLNFMGNELGQLREWDENRQQDWLLLKYPLHDSFHRFVRELSMLYKNSPSLHDGEYNSNCFKWLEADAAEECVYAYQRSGGGQVFIIVMNVSDRAYENFRIGCYEKYYLKELINSDDYIYSGGGMVNEGIIEAEECGYKGKPYSFRLKLAPFGSVMFETSLEAPEKSEKQSETED